MTKTAILIDGGFYRKRAAKIWGKKTPAERAKELHWYCKQHLGDKDWEVSRILYRIFYYDCNPVDKQVYHPLTQKPVILKKTETYQWSLDFYEELKKKRKFALRLGYLSSGSIHYNLKPEVTKALCERIKTIDDLTETDFSFNVEQKGVDMRIGIDISSMVFKKQINQVVLISGDSDFVPAAKMARREGIDFILDSMGAPIKDDLFEHIDGLKSHWKECPGS